MKITTVYSFTSWKIRLCTWVLTYFKLLQIKLLWTLVYVSSCEYVLSFFLSKCLEIEWLGHMRCMFNFLENAKLLYKMIMPFYIPISNVWKFWYPTSSPAVGLVSFSVFVFCFFFHLRHSNQKIVLSHCGYTLHFPGG